MTAKELITALLEFPLDATVEYPGEHEGDSCDITEIRYFGVEIHGYKVITLR